MSNRANGWFLSFFLMVSASPAVASFCDAHYRFDGDLSDASGNGYNGQMIVKGGEPSTPAFVQGKNGQALKLTGVNAMRAPLDLHHENCPQMTVAAWVQIEPEPSQMIFSNNGGNWLFNSVTGLSVRSTGKDLWADGKPVRANGGWFFVAAVWDYTKGYHRLHWRTRSKEASFAGREPLNPESAIWIGADNDKLHRPAKDMLVDEIRFIGRALSKEEVLALRREGLNTASSATQISAIRASAPVDAPAAKKAIGETEKNIAGDPSAQLPGDQYEPREPPGDQYACKRLPGDQYTCKALPGDQYDFAALPGDQYEYDRLPGDQYEPRELPGDQYACRKLPGDQYACKELPGDQYDFAALPGDQYDPRALPGGQYDVKALPGDQYEPSETARIGQGVGEIPGALKNPDFQSPGIAPDLKAGNSRIVGQLPNDMENPDVSQLPAGAPNPQYDSPEAAEEAARQRAEAQEAQYVQDQQQALAPDRKPRPVGAPKLSGLSGYEGEEIDMFDMRSEFIHTMTWWEKNNRPCRLELNGDKAVGCSDLYLSPQTVSLGDDTAIGSIEVCSTSNDNQRMKGIRVSGDKVNADGSTTYWPNASTARRPNCSEWHKAVLCPSNTLATGVVLHRNRGGLSNEEIVGLQLICRAIGME